MSGARLEARAGGAALIGALDLAGVTALAAGPVPDAAVDGCVRLDLSGVTHCASAGVALIVDWMAALQGRGLQLELVGVPEQMRAIARVADLEGVLPGV